MRYAGRAVKGDAVLIGARTGRRPRDALQQVAGVLGRRVCGHDDLPKRVPAVDPQKDLQLVEMDVALRRGATVQVTAAGIDG